MDEVSLYGNATTSGELTEEEMALISKADCVAVRDGDDMVDIKVNEEGSEEAPAEGTEEAPTDKPEDDTDKTPEGLEGKIKGAQEALAEVGADLATKGVNVEGIVDEFNSSGGKLSDKTYESLAKNGYSKAVVDSIIAGQVAISNSFANAVIQVAGGQEEFTALAEFGRTNDPGTVRAYNAALERGDLDTVKALLGSLKAQRTAKYGTANKQITGKPTANPNATQGYKDRSEMVKAINDKRYSTDAAYRGEVERKVVASTFM